MAETVITQSSDPSFVVLYGNRRGEPGVFDLQDTAVGKNVQLFYSLYLGYILHTVSMWAQVPTVSQKIH